MASTPPISGAYANPLPSSGDQPALGARNTTLVLRQYLPALNFSLELSRTRRPRRWIMRAGLPSLWIYPGAEREGERWGVAQQRLVGDLARSAKCSVNTAQAYRSRFRHALEEHFIRPVLLRPGVRSAPRRSVAWVPQPSRCAARCRHSAPVATTSARMNELQLGDLVHGFTALLVSASSVVFALID